MPYTKFHDPWATTDILSARAWNHLETQWDYIKAEADAHTHDTRYYTKPLADTTFFSTSFYAGFDADKLDGSHLSDIIANVMPIGAIMIWSGTDANIPAGWAICNGGSGTPDLRDKFVIGSGGAYAIGNTGGAFSTAISGSITIGDHAITNDEMPLHTHTYSDKSNTPFTDQTTNYVSYPITLAYTTRTTGSDGSGGAHGHAGSTITFNNLSAIPPYYALYYIQKVN